MRAGERDELRTSARSCSTAAPQFSERPRNLLPEAMPDEDLVNALAQYLEFEPMEKLALLERPGALARADR
jgi:hypothetical protein